mmetsp:Transcript_51059/g.143728  ORF Transcript_51059/g.143728 Transcript_51059/m.143728 type:complete len:295 (+) Transcript_51059:239-1123(+)
MPSEMSPKALSSPSVSAASCTISRQDLFTRPSARSWSLRSAATFSGLPFSAPASGPQIAACHPASSSSVWQLRARSALRHAFATSSRRSPIFWHPAASASTCWDRSPSIASTSRDADPTSTRSRRRPATRRAAFPPVLSSRFSCCVTRDAFARIWDSRASEAAQASRAAAIWSSLSFSCERRASRSSRNWVSCDCSTPRCCWMASSSSSKPLLLVWSCSSKPCPWLTHSAAASASASARNSLSTRSPPRCSARPTRGAAAAAASPWQAGRAESAVQALFSSRKLAAQASATSSC